MNQMAGRLGSTFLSYAEKYYQDEDAIKRSIATQDRWDRYKSQVVQRVVRRDAHVVEPPLVTTDPEDPAYVRHVRVVADSLPASPSKPSPRSPRPQPRTQRDQPRTG